MCKRLALLFLMMCTCMMSAQAATIEWISDYYDQDANGIVDDGGWVDLLRAQGYTVNVRSSSTNTTYWRNGTTDVALTAEILGYLNAADLIIISRSTDSTNYANGDTERNSWNGITKPMILISAAIAQNNRLRWLNNATQTYLVGTTRLEAVVPTHPIFTGVTLDASNQVDIIDPAKGYRAESPTNALTVLATTSAGNGTLIARVVGATQYVWIAEWTPGTVFYSGTTANTPGGKRLLFCAGTRERTTAGSEIGRGVYNLNANGQKMFINAVHYMLGESIVSGAADVPNPAYKATDVVRDIILSWKPGKYAKTHNVYFGTSFAEVDAATTTTHPNVQLSQNQDPNTYDPPGLLTLSQTYYWRVDEVNAPPNTSTFFKGSVWSFTVEPPAFRMSNITTTASSYITGSEPGKSVDNSGINTANDQHGTDVTTMWLSDTTPQPTWIKYEFDKVYKMQEMWVWNSNQSTETSVGFGIKAVKVEYSTDNTNWTQLSSISEFAQAPGTASCVHQTVNLGGVAAKYVRITALSNFKGLVQQYGLSEVRFFYIPAQAREPSPTNGQTDVTLDTVLRWRAGREAATHKLYFSTNRKAVVDGTIASINIPVSGSYASYSPLSLDLGKTYYWKVDEVDNTTTWPGDLWSFSTIGYLTLDDFEDYNNSSPKRVFQKWLDGVGYSADQYFPVAYGGNGSNAAVGHDIWAAGSPYTNIMETSIFNSGKQSVPIDYNDTKLPYYSETERVWTPTQDWTKLGIKSLTIWFRGIPPAFLETSPGVYFMSGTGTDIWGTADQGRFVYKQLTGDGTIIARVDSVANTDLWAKAGVMIRATPDAGSAYAFLLMAPEYGCRFQLRSTTGGSATSDSAVTTLAAVRTPHWVKLERVGNTFTAYDSNDPATEGWHPLAWGPQTITMTNNVYIGLAVTSHQAGAVCGAKFSNVSTSANVTGQWQTADLGIAQPTGGNTAEPLYVALEDNTVKKIVPNPDPNAVFSSTWQEWNIPLSQFTGVNLGSIKKMYIGTGNRTSPVRGGAGILYIDDIRLYPQRCLPLVQKPAADINSDCAVDYLDLDVMVDQWLLTAPPARTADLNADNKVDLKDFAKLAQGWLEELLWP